VVLVQIAVPSRLDVPLHQQLQQRLHLLVGQINGKYGTLDGRLPIHYLDTSVNFAELVALYAASSAMVITSLRDGMNLVSFEWCVCQQYKPRPWNVGDAGAVEGVLILSEFAGAADHLDDGCLLVNPYDTTSMAEAFHEALSMDVPRRQALHRKAYDYVTAATASSWAERFVKTLTQLQSANGLVPDASSASNMAGLLAMLAQQKRIVFLTDYDGTLTPIVSNPDDARLPEATREKLAKLAQQIPTGIVSGRSREKIDAFVGLPNMWVAGAHGFDIAGPAGSGVTYRPVGGYLDALAAAADELQLALATVSGALVENNGFAISVHYRNVAPAEHNAIEAAVEAVLVGQPDLTRFPGKMVLELRPKFDWNKGKAVEYILDQIGKDIGEPIYPIYLGDDVSDEDAFAVLQERGGLGILISNGMVAQGQTKASFRLRSPREVADILAKLSAICDGQE